MCVKAFRTWNNHHQSIGFFMRKDPMRLDSNNACESSRTIRLLNKQEISAADRFLCVDPSLKCIFEVYAGFGCTSLFICSLLCLWPVNKVNEDRMLLLNIQIWPNIEFKIELLQFEIRKLNNFLNIWISFSCSLQQLILYNHSSMIF